MYSASPTSPESLRAKWWVLWAEWLERYPEIYSLEDGLAEEDWEGWAKLTQQLGGKVQLVADDIFVTNPEIFSKGIRAWNCQLDPDQAQPDRDDYRNSPLH